MSIVGFGGKGGGGGRTPVETKDSLQSKAVAKVIDLISEGEIEGLVNGARSIFLDDTPLQAEDGKYNFTGVSMDTRLGTQQQSYMSGFSDVENVTAIGVRVQKPNPFIRRISNININKVRVTIGIPALSVQDLKTGDINGTTVALRFSLSTNNGPYLPINARFETKSYPVAMQTADEITGATVTLQWKRIFLIAPTSYTYSATGAFGQNMVTRLINQTRLTTATLRLRASKDGAPAFTVATFDVSGQTDGKTLNQSWTGPLANGRYQFFAELVSGEGTVTLTEIQANAILSQDAIFTGKTSSRYQRSYEIPLAGVGPWDIKVERVTDDGTSAALNNQTFVDSISEVIEQKLRYPNSALIALSVDASQFSSVPRRAYDVKLLRVKVPANYNPLTRGYTGNWNGTFKIAWTDNPAWCFYDLVTNPRYGLGTFVPEAQVDKWAMYQIAKYCDEMVPDGKNGVEPRFTCNVYLASRAEAYKVVNDMASVFRGLVFWSSGTITAVQDSPSDAAYLYAPANVIEGAFTYTGSSAKARHTVALVTWNDPADFYKQKVEYVEDTIGIGRYGYVTTEIGAIGCTSQGQARRLGQWLLLSERLESEVVSFKVGMDGAIARPGQIIKVADPSRTGERLGGRLKTVSATSITLDSLVNLANGVAYTLSVLTQAGGVQDRTVIGTGAPVSILAISPAFTDIPQAGSMWVLSSTVVQAQLFRVIGVTEDEFNEFTISALAYEPGKYDSVEYGTELQPRVISSLQLVPGTPVGLTVSESVYIAPAGVKVRLSVSWELVDTATRYRVTVTRKDNNEQPALETSSNSIEFLDVAEDVYTISVTAINSLGIAGNAATVIYAAQGKLTVPSNVMGFTASRIDTTLRFAWFPIPDADLAYYEIRLGDVWATGVPVFSSSVPTAQIESPRGGVYQIKAFDTSGNESADPAIVTVPDNRNINVMVAYNEAAGGFNGIRMNTSLNMTPLGVILDADETIGTYVSEIIDIGIVAKSLVYLEPVVQALAANPVPWSGYTQPWSFYQAPQFKSWLGNFDGIAASYELSLSMDGIVWSDFFPYTIGAHQFRYIRSRVTLEASTIDVRPILTQFITRIDVPDRVEHYKSQAVPIGGLTISFMPNFVSVETVQVTQQAGAIGDTFTVTNKTGSGVTINLYNSAGTAISGLVDVDVFGYGEKI